MEAAGVGPVPPQDANGLMARDFRRDCLEIRRLVVNSLCSEVLPSLGDIMETGDGCEEPEPETRNGFPASRPFTIPSVVAVAHDDP